MIVLLPIAGWAGRLTKPKLPPVLLWSRLDELRIPQNALRSCTGLYCTVQSSVLYWTLQHCVTQTLVVFLRPPVQ